MCALVCEFYFYVIWCLHGEVSFSLLFFCRNHKEPFGQNQSSSSRDVIGWGKARERNITIASLDHELEYLEWTLNRLLGRRMIAFGVRPDFFSTFRINVMCCWVPNFHHVTYLHHVLSSRSMVFYKITEVVFWVSFWIFGSIKVVVNTSQRLPKKITYSPLGCSRKTFWRFYVLQRISIKRCNASCILGTEKVMTSMTTILSIKELVTGSLGLPTH